MDARLARLQHSILQRQERLVLLASALSKRSKVIRRGAAATRLLTIGFGAFSATQAAAVKLWGPECAVVIVTYALVGVGVAVIGGINASFKLDERAAKILVLQARCHSDTWDLDSQWQKALHPPTEAEKILACERVLDSQNAALKEIQAGAAQIGVDLPNEVITDEPQSAT